jgi:hypothetical protein
MDAGRARLGMTVAGFEEQEDHEHDQAGGQLQRELDVVHRLADRHRPVAPDSELHRRRQLLLELRQERLDAVHHLHRVRAGLPLDREVDRARAVVPPGVALVLDAGVHVGDLVQPHGAAVRTTQRPRVRRP